MSSICDKWHRYCKNCGNKVHVNQVRTHDYRSKECAECGEKSWTRNRAKVST